MNTADEKHLIMDDANSASEHWTTSTYEANVVNIHYRRTGPGQPPLIALHGLTGSGACWTPLARALEDRYDVVMPDARGHGASGAPSAGYLYRDHAGDVLGLIDALKLPHPVLLGHSMGGMTAAVVASQLGLTLRGVILVDPTFISPEWQREVYESDVAEQHRQALRSAKSELVAQARLRHPQRSLELIEILAEARHQTDSNAFEVLTPPNPDFRELIRRIRAPILLVTGENGVVSLETAQALRTLNPRLRSEQIAGVGHGIPYDAPERLATVVKSFLGELIDP